MRRMLQWIVDVQLRWAGPVGGVLQPPFEALFHRIRPVRDLLTGTWLGHPLHPAITDLPIGAFVVTFVLDLANLRTAADVALAVGLVGMVAAAVSGLADYSDTFGRPRDVGTLHALTMVLALVIYVISLVIRLGEPADRTPAIALGVVGLLLVIFGGFVGGDLVFGLGNVVDRHAWDEGGKKWRALDLTEIPEATPVKAKAGNQTLVVVRHGETIFGLHDTCSHAGGPLSEGTIVGDCIECPWHGSRYRLADGRLCAGPGVFDQPRFEVRAAEAGGYEARRID